MSKNVYGLYGENEIARELIMIKY